MSTDAVIDIDKRTNGDAPVTSVVHNPYGSPPGSGVTLPPGYQPTPSVKNKNNYFPQSEPLGPDEMRIIFMGSQPWPPRLSQAGTCIMVELGNGKRFFFDFGPGCLRNIIANQVPIPEINDIFLTHLHLDHYADIPYLWQFAPFNGRWKPLRIHGPSSSRPELGTRAMVDHMAQMGLWTSIQAQGMPLHDGYEFEVNEFDYRDDGGVCYDKDGVVITHWRRSHAADGASAYRLDWNGLSFVWTGDGKPDKLTAQYAKGVDVFVTEMAVDIVRLWALKQGVSPFIGAFTVDNFHTTHYAFGYLANLVQPRLAMATHVSFDRELVGEMMAGVRMHYPGFFAFGIDHTVVNVTKDNLWIREAALPESTNTARASSEWLLQNQFDGAVPPPAMAQNPFTPIQEQYVRDQEIDPALFTPTDQVRQWAHPLPPTFPLDPAKTLGL
ncbi:putative ribonuclease Z [Candidatus Promineifilum breve]|uniref:Ribonuclease Z n=1 Tax=Candidatus Promineifilum breve TaxID=1806508 RepID=A0A160T0E5_9CHLR|nr:guanitoxin biosynthesis MBL fold metallo-hydrolase GntH [Candidatus Promineifilum breve]CUS03226.2 putative ribonuclease Z [Candidatus Promineifilum breve]